MDLAFLITGALVVILTGISKSGFAGGLGVLSVPALSLFVAPQAAAAIMLPILCVIDVSNVIKYRKDWVKRLVFLLIPGALIGILIGSASFSLINQGWLKLAIGMLALWFTYTTLAANLSSNAGNNPRKPAGSIAAVLLGTVAGFTSFVAHAGGPPIKGFLLSQRLGKTPMVATNSYFFFVMNAMKLVPYFLLGQFSADNLKLSLMLLPFAPIGIFIGFRLHRLVSQDHFVKIVCALLAFAGFKLIWDGISLLSH